VSGRIVGLCGRILAITFSRLPEWGEVAMAGLRSLMGALRRYPDPAASTDPLISGLLHRLATVPPPPGPSPEFTTQLHAQLVAVTPRLVAEDATGTAQRRGRRWLPGRRFPLRRPLAVAGALVVIFALLLGGAVWLSSGSLPGDSLYGLKRASENVQLSLTGGTGARAKEYLTLAKRRAKEVGALLSRVSAPAAGAGPLPAGGINTRTAKLITDTLGDADSDLRNASRLLTEQAVTNRSADPLGVLHGAVPDQISRLGSIVNRIPPGQLHERARASEQLAVRVLDRADRLRADLGCSCLTGTPSDDLGPLPCSTPCAAPRATPGTPGSPSGAPSGTNGPGSAPPSSGGTAAPPTRRTTATRRGAAAPHTAAASSAPARGSPGPTLTSLGSGSSSPSGSASQPITVDSCGVTVTLGSLGLGVGTCGLDPHQ
jgi:uncharacterized protein DUF5667